MILRVQKKKQIHVRIHKKYFFMSSDFYDDVQPLKKHFIFNLTKGL